jgi:hypothetical protein
MRLVEEDGLIEIDVEGEGQGRSPLWAGQGHGPPQDF